MGLPEFEQNEFDADGNWISGPQHPKPGTPVEPGATEAPGEEPKAAEESKSGDGEHVFDPDDHTVEEVVDYAADHPDEVERLINDEKNGQNRKTLLAALAE